MQRVIALNGNGNPIAWDAGDGIPSGHEDVEGGVSGDGGGGIVCVVIASGLVKCWGNNSNGALGKGGNEDSQIPVGVFYISNTKEIAVGQQHVCAKNSESIQCWGLNRNGQLGDGCNDSSNVAVMVVGW